MVSDGHLTRYQKASYKSTHGKLRELWRRYEEEELPTTMLLRHVSYMAGFDPAEERERE